VSALRGSCLCGGVRYEIEGGIDRASHCHCTMCQKAHGAAMGSYGRATRAGFRLTAGADLVARYRSSAEVERTFCSRCGSTLQWDHLSDREHVGVALGTLDDDPGVRPGVHIHVTSKAPWFEITDALPQLPTVPRPKS
jgi:hypothetical protein